MPNPIMFPANYKYKQYRKNSGFDDLSMKTKLMNVFQKIIRKNELNDSNNSNGSNTSNSSNNTNTSEPAK